jgi:hypothetical protein
VYVSISIADIFPPNRRFDFYCRFLPAKLTSRFLLPSSSRQFDESISIADFFPPNRRVVADFFPPN